jgi:ABC transporter
VRASLGIAHVLERRRVFPHLTVLQNLTLGAWHSAAKAARARTLERVFALFPRLSECKSQLAHTLSGGEQQMLALGRGLMALPRLLMVDEPFLGLAPRVVEQMKSVFQALQAEGIAILFIEQSPTRPFHGGPRLYPGKRTPRDRGRRTHPNQQPGGTTDFSGWIRDRTMRTQVVCWVKQTPSHLPTAHRTGLMRRLAVVCITRGNVAQIHCERDMAHRDWTGWLGW